MAQLYKMTLYVCDLEENLSLSEIKRLIEDDALDGISTSCVTHFLFDAEMKVAVLSAELVLAEIKEKEQHGSSK